MHVIDYVNDFGTRKNFISLQNEANLIQPRRFIWTRSMGKRQITLSDIAKELNITQGAVSYNLKQLKQNAVKEGLDTTYLRVMVAGAGVEKLKEARLI